MKMIKWALPLLFPAVFCYGNDGGRDRFPGDTTKIEERIEKAMNAPTQGSFSPYENDSDDWEAFREGWALARKGMSDASREFLKAMSEVDWKAMGDESRQALERAAQAAEEVDWEALRQDMEEAGMKLDSLVREMERRIKEE